MERFLYRLSKSSYADKFILKGALMLPVWKAPLARPTMDIDMLGQIDNSIEVIVDVIKSICTQHVKPDGITFDADSVRGTRITEDADYEGVRIKFQGKLGIVRFNMQVDIGFGDVVVPPATPVAYPIILDLPRPHLLGYSMESTIAEKLEAMVKLGILNSRMKDFFDIWFLAHHFNFSGRTLQKAVKTTFLTRSTNLPSIPVVFTADFFRDPTKDAQWKAFIRKNQLVNIPKGFQEIVADIVAFLGPLVKYLACNQSFVSSWKAPGPWR